jgi:exodeoxyribonuclease (lambda-induced)
MNLYDKHIKILSGLTDVFGFNPAEVEQGDPEWHSVRAGVLTASNADKILMKKGTQGRQTYMSSLIAQICTCKAPEEMPFKALEHGKLYESVARDALSVSLGFVDIKEIAFMFKDESLRVGVSPDGLFDKTIIELKCPLNAENYFNFAAFDTSKSAWEKQCQFQMWAAGAERHIFAQYHPDVVLCENLFWRETEADPAIHKELDEKVPEFIREMDMALASLGVKFGDHHKYIKQQRGNAND